MILPTHHRSAIIAHARREAPDEACGVLAGIGGRVRRSYRLPNVAEDRTTRFLADPEAQLRAFRDMERRGLELLAVYHSHLRSAARPSPTDVELAYYPGACHIIISLAGSRASVKGFQIENGDVSELVLSSGRAPRAGPRN